MAASLWLLATLTIGHVVFPGALAKCIWKEVKGTSIPGGSDVLAYSLSECQSICLEQDGCQSIDYDTEGICTLHTTQDGKRPSPDSSHFDYICEAEVVTKPPESQDGCTWTQVTKPGVPEGILIPPPVTIEACQDACRRKPGCQHFDWVDSFRFCYLPGQPSVDRYVRYELTCAVRPTGWPPITPTVWPPKPSIRPTGWPPITPTVWPPKPSIKPTGWPPIGTTDEPLIRPTGWPPIGTTNEPSKRPTVWPPIATTNLPSNRPTVWPPVPTSAKPPATTTKPPATTTKPPATTTKPPATTTTPPATTTTLPVCKARLDLVFVVDGSGSICRLNVPTCDNWKFNLQFIHKIIESQIIGPDDTRVGLVMFSDNASVEFNLNKYADNTSLLTAIDNLRYPLGQTNTTGALKTLASAAFTRASGDRPDVPNVSILITDGNPTKDVDELPAATKLVHTSGIYVLVVGVSKSVNETTVRNLSSDPQQIDKTYFLATDYSSIDRVRDELLQQTCARGST